MLRRVNATRFEAPAGARIQVVAESRNNNGVNDARFEYAAVPLDREGILGLPGCSFTVQDTPQRLEAIVMFDDAAAGSARYDLFEVENGVQNQLGKFTLKSDLSNQIDFSILPVDVEVALPAAASRQRRGVTRARKTARKRTAPKKPGPKTPARAGAKRKTARRRVGGTRKRR